MELVTSYLEKQIQDAFDLIDENPEYIERVFGELIEENRAKRNRGGRISDYTGGILLHHTAAEPSPPPLRTIQDGPGFHYVSQRFDENKDEFIKNMNQMDRIHKWIFGIAAVVCGLGIATSFLYHLTQ